MIATVKNLGVVGSATVDLQRPLTVFCGPNSTGKTYLSYVLFSIYEDSFNHSVTDLRNIADEMRKAKEFTLSPGLAERYMQGLARHIKRELGIIFGIAEDTAQQLFPTFEIDIKLSDGEYEAMEQRACDISFRKGKDTTVTIEKAPNSSRVVYTVSGDIDDGASIRDNELQMLLNIWLHKLCLCQPAGVRMLTVERNSIYTFKTELSVARNTLVDAIQQRTPDGIVDILNSNTRRYPLAVRSSLHIANDITNVKKLKSPYATYAQRLEKGVLHGSVKISKEGNVEFNPRGMKPACPLPIHMSSSIVKTMSSLVVYLKHIAQKGDLLIIDEPEMNFHPDVQVELAKILATLSKQGLRIIVSTHSDYIIREFNNLIMGHALNAKYPERLERKGYTADMLLRKEDIAVKYFHSKKKSPPINVEDIEVTDIGFDVKSIDDTIDRQNKIGYSLYDLLLEEQL